MFFGCDGLNFKLVNPRQDLLAYNIFDFDYELFSSSLLCYGQEEAMKRYVAGLIYKAFTDGGTIEKDIVNPCMNSHYGKKVRFD